MAGAGYKLFNTGDVLTAAQVNTYLQEQAVMRFANSTARTTALSGVLAEGMMSYLDDTNSVEVYNGSAWVSVGSTGDITGVTAGTGISGGGTSGDVTITNSMATAIDAKGDLIVGTGADTFARLAVGATNGHILTVDSAEATGMKWAAAAGGGKVLQVVGATYSTETGISTDTFTDTGLTVTITPTANTSKILVLTQCIIYADTSNSTTTETKIRLMRDATAVWTSNNATSWNVLTAVKIAYPIMYLDSPATTSAITYKIQSAENPAANHTLAWHQGNNTSTITVLEIGA